MTNKRKNYRRYVEKTTETPQTPKRYDEALEELNKEIQESVYDMTEDELWVLHKRLSKNGDLYQFNLITARQAPSAAVKKLIKFLKHEQNNCQSSL